MEFEVRFWRYIIIYHHYIMCRYHVHVSSKTRHEITIIGGGFVTPRVHSGLTYPSMRARLRPPLRRAGGSLYPGASPLPHMRRLDFPAGG